MIDPISLTIASMQNDVERMNLLSNHAANALTPGFKRSLVAVSNAAPNGGPLDVSGSVPVQVAVLDLHPGVPRKTGLPLDIALVGDGFFEIRTDTSLAYTRAGAFHLDEKGRLVTQAGDPVSGTGGDIVLTTSTPLIDRDGRLYEKGNQVGQLKIVNFDHPEKLQVAGAGLFVPGSGATAQDAPHPQMLQGHLESSNVDSTREMVSMIEGFRHFETSQRLLQVYDDLRDKTFRTLGQF